MPVSDWFCISQRSILGIMGFFAVLNAYTMRVSFTIALSDMVVKTKINVSQGTCGKSAFSDEKIHDDNHKFDWSQQLQGTILSSFYWGYTLTHFPGGIIADKFGGKWTLSLGILSTAIFTMLTPTFVDMGGSNGLMITRACMGLGEGTTFPALSVLLAHWIPLKERGKYGALTYGGAQVGSMLGNALSGVIINRFNSWRPVFYFWGIIAVIWFITFTIICSNDPGSHPYIKESEKEYLLAELGQLERNRNLPPVPFKAILTSLPVFAMIIAQTGHNWGFYTMTTDLPKYMADVLNFSVKKNGYYTAITFLVMWIWSLLSGVLCDFVISHKYITVTNARKLWTILSFIGPGVFMVLASYSGCNKLMAVVCFTICMGFMGVWFSGMKLNSLDLSPNYAGTLMAISNGIGASMGIISPILIGFLTPHASLKEWRSVFWITLVIFIFSSVIVALFATGDIQPWNEPDKMVSKQDKNEKT